MTGKGREGKKSTRMMRKKENVKRERVQWVVASDVEVVANSGGGTLFLYSRPFNVVLSLFSLFLVLEHKISKKSFVIIYIYIHIFIYARWKEESRQSVKILDPHHPYLFLIIAFCMNNFSSFSSALFFHT